MKADHPEQRDAQLPTSAESDIDAFFAERAEHDDLRRDASPWRRLLGLLETGPAFDADRQTRINAAIAGIRAHEAAGSDEPRLSREDRDAIDSLVLAGFRPERVPSALRERAEAASGLLERTSAVSADEQAWLDSSRSARIDGVMATIASSKQRSALPFEQPAARGGFRFNDLIAVAAMLLLASAVAIPVFGSVRQQQVQSACFGRLGSVAMAVGQYAGDHRDTLPMATAGFGSSWMRVGQDASESNSANLFTLARTGHATVSQLACPGNPFAPETMEATTGRDWRQLREVSFSYQILPEELRRVYALPAGSVVLTDRSPVVLRAAAGQPIVPEENSPNHRTSAGEGLGQHLLHLDGSTEFVTSPVLARGDNLWLPRGVEIRIHAARTLIGVIQGDELPDSPEDAFVGP